MIQRDTFSPKSLNPQKLKTMDLNSTPTSKYIQAPPFLASHGEPALEANVSIYKKENSNPFADTFTADPLCRLNLKETSEFVKSFSVMNNNNGESKGFLERRRDKRMEAPQTPGRPVFSFSAGNMSRKGFPSKWDDAEKWLVSTSCHESPAHQHHNHAISVKPVSESSKVPKQSHYDEDIKKQTEAFAEKTRVVDEKVSQAFLQAQGPLSRVEHHKNSVRGAFNGVFTAADVVLKDKFTDDVEASYRYSEPTKEGFLFSNSRTGESMKETGGTEMVHEVQHRDIGTEMTPLGSSTTSRCHTPFKSSSPARHNTPANRSGPLVMPNHANTNTIDIAQLQECHLAKLHLGSQFDSITSNWSSREEEEEDISKSLRHFDTSNASRKSVSESRACAWEEEEQTKCCLRYQREEAKIQAWVNLQHAKAEAQSRKLEVKIERMRSNLEEKLMKRMAFVHRKAEEWRVVARQQHSEQIQKASQQARKIASRNNLHLSGHSTCGCFPCNNH
ncbi:Remorin, C-terminal [Dillenia turbinata]|uniref:Remorin, C-terminal n=1 Tax=Dillenia turbinata TaxID=194707 RepID=A0AAN8UFM2_9MAGN